MLLADDFSVGQLQGHAAGNRRVEVVLRLPAGRVKGQSRFETELTGNQ